MRFSRCAALQILLACSLMLVWGQRGINRNIKIINTTRGRILVFWVHPQTREPSLMSDPEGIPSGAEFPLDSYVGHEFEVRELASKKTGSCATDVCRHAYFAVTANDDQSANVKETEDSFEVEFVDNKIKASLQAKDLIADCRKLAATKLANGDASAMDDFTSCVQGGVATALEEVNEEIAFQASVRKDIAATLGNYTCIDESLNSTDDLETKIWADPKENQKSYTVHVKHNRAASKIHTIDSFIQPDECAAMEEAARSTLHDATVADGKGGSRLSENRKAKQAGIKVPWDVPDHPISKISRRVYDYANSVLGLNIDEHGQEDLMSIQYFGRGRNATEPDRYTPHCDGDCTGSPFKWGTRMATVVMYCTIADEGGHTNFRNAGVHVKPEPFSAVFFSYIDPATKVMDTGFTEHSGCPVFGGEKKIVTQWIRLGVSTEEPWDSFNTLGIRKKDMEEDE